jgi:hypothetical protein
MSELARFVDQKITSGILRLNALPDADPFWVNTNREPTISKMADFCVQLLKTDPQDLDARWALFACDVSNGSSDLGYTVIEPLLVSDLRHIRWLSASAKWGYFSFGGAAIHCFHEALSKLGSKVPSLETRLKQLLEDKDPAVREGAAWALSVLDGGNPFEPES